MATIYKPKYSIDIINDNFASNGANMDQFISNNFTTDDNTAVQIVSPIASAIDIDLAKQIFKDYGDGPISVGLKNYLTQINITIQIGSESIFYDSIPYGSNIDFSNATLDVCKHIVDGNLNMSVFILNTTPELADQYNSIVASIVIALRKGEYDYNNYIASLQPVCRKIAEGIVKKYG